MNPCELTASITALANYIACKLPEENTELLAAALTQLGDTLTTILAQRNVCRKLESSKDAP